MIKKAIGRMSRMCDEAWYIFMGTLKLSCAMLLCAFMLLVSPQGGYERTMLAAALALSCRRFSRIGTAEEFLTAHRGVEHVQKSVRAQVFGQIQLTDQL